jgi:RNA polymerase sigma-70 factor, ECF subfamily
MSTKLKWEDLMVEAQKGNSKMYDTLLTEVSGYLQSYLRYKIRAEETASDLLQEILISLHRARHTYDSQLPFKPWLFKIVQSRLIDYYRKNGKRDDYKLMSDDSYMDTLCAEAEVSQLEVIAFNNAISSLSDDQRRVLCAIKFDGKSIKEVSVEFNMSVSAVKVTAHRAYKLLFEKLEVGL